MIMYIKKTIILLAIVSCLFRGLVQSGEHVASTYFYTDLLDEYPEAILCDDDVYLVDIEYHIRDAHGNVRYVGTELFLWDSEIKPRLEAKLLENSAGHIVCAHAYTYDEHGFLIKTVIQGHRNHPEEDDECGKPQLLEVIFENCLDGPTRGKPAVIEEYAFDEESGHFTHLHHTINHFDAHGRLQNQDIDDLFLGQRHHRIFAYDGWGRVVRIEDSRGRCEEILYDSDGNRLQIDRAHDGEAAGIKRYVYDEKRRLVEIEEAPVHGMHKIKTLHYQSYHVAPPVPSEDTVVPQTDPTHIDHKNCRIVNDEWICNTDCPDRNVSEDIPEESSEDASTLSYVSDLCTGWASRVQGALSGLKEKLSYVNYAGNEIDEGLHNIFGGTFLKLSGYFKHEAQSGNFGSGEEINPKVRITMINGILNIREDLQINIHALSNSHGEATIHYVFRPTEGWMSDLLNCIMVKCSYTSPQARLLAEKWKELIADMGGVDGGGKILHYAHSVGGTDTYHARYLLSPEEQKMIHVFTIGSPTMIPDEGFGSVINFVSKRDGVCMLDPIGYINGLWNKDSNVVFLGSYLGMPFVEHTLNTQSYNNLLKTLGTEFLSAYAESPSESPSE